MPHELVHLNVYRILLLEILFTVDLVIHFFRLKQHEFMQYINILMELILLKHEHPFVVI